MVALSAWPWFRFPDHLLGAPELEADNHLWMLWRASVGGGPWAAWPEGFDKPLMDLPHLPVYWVGSWVSPAVGYALCWLVDVALAAAGGFLLAREVGASRPAALVGLVATACLPVMAGLLSFGISEGWPVGAYSLYLWAALRLARTGALGDLALAAATLALFALTGWYHALFALLAAPVVVGWAHAHGAHVRRVVAAGLAAVVLVLPVLWRFVAQGHASDLAERAPQAFEPRADWLHSPSWGVDLLALVTPTLQDLPLSRTAYLGVSVLLLAALSGRRQRWAWVGAVWMAIFTLGHHLTVAGVPIPSPEPVRLPAAWLSAAVPVLYGLANWYRAAGMVGVFLAPLAALGAQRLAGARSGVLAVLLAVVWLDLTVLSDAPWPRIHYAREAPKSLLAVPGEGPLLLFPFDNGQRRWPQRVPRAYQRWQVDLQRPLTEHYEGPDPLLEVPVVAWIDRRCHGSRPLMDVWAREQTVPEHAPALAEGQAQLGALAGQGLEAVAIVLPRAVDPRGCRREAEHYLGRPAGGDDTVIWWTLTP